MRKAGPGWSNVPGEGYEVSSLGDKRFSALYAQLPDGRTIEDAWGQAKGYPDGRAAKGRPALAPDFDYWATYKGLWSQWAQANPDLMSELAAATQGKRLVDRFARTDNNQARALAELLQERQWSGTPMPEQPAAQRQPTGQQAPDAVQLELQVQQDNPQRKAGDVLPWILAAAGGGLAGLGTAQLLNQAPPPPAGYS